MSSQQRPVGKALSLVIALLIIVGVGYFKFHHSSTIPATPHHTARQTSPTSQPPAATHTDAALQKLIDSWAATQSTNTAVVVRELSGNKRQASRNADHQMTTASTYKLFVAYAALHEVEQGTYSLQTPTRTGQTVEAALDKMILQSDNDSAEALGFLIGWDRIDNLAADIGATRTHINNYDSAGQPTVGDKVSTANDLALLVIKLQQGSLLNRTNSELLLGLMKRQVWRERIPSGIPVGIAVADKPGWLSPADGVNEYVENDAAVVYGPTSTYVLVVMTDGSSTQPLANLSAQIYHYLET